MPDRDIGALGKAQAEQAFRRVERRFDHAIEIEIRLDLRLIDIAALLPQLLRVIAPVPGREREVAALLLHERLQRVAVGLGARPRPRPHRVEQVADGGLRFRHGVVQPVMGEVGIAEQPGALGAQPHHLGDDRLVVGLAAIVAARDERAINLFAQVAALREFQERLGARTRQRHDIAVQAAFLRIGFHRLAHEVGQAGKLGLVVQGECEALLVGEHILAERCAELRQPLDDLRQPLFRLAVERGAGAAKGCVIALEHALLLGGKVERLALLHQSIDAAKEPALV